MPNWHEILTEINQAGSQYDIFRRTYLKKLHEKTGRNLIIYYSGWLQRSRLPGFVAQDFSVNDADKNGFMTVIHKMDVSKGLDLILHTPGARSQQPNRLWIIFDQCLGPISGLSFLSSRCRLAQ